MFETHDSRVGKACPKEVAWRNPFKIKIEEFLLWVKDPAFPMLGLRSQLWLKSDPWPRNSIRCGAAKKRKKKKIKIESFCWSGCKRCDMGCILLSRNPSAISTSKAWPKDQDMSRTAGSLSWVLATLPSSAYPASGHQYVSTFKTQRFKRHISYATSSPRELQRIWERAGSFQWPWLLFQAYLMLSQGIGTCPFISTRE